MSLQHAKSIFPEKYLYGRILEFLYEYAHDEFTEEEIKKRFPQNDGKTLDIPLINLENDDLVVVTRTPTMKTGTNSDQPFIKSYRISTVGYRFIYELLKDRKSDQFAYIALYIAIASLLICTYTLLRPILFG